MEQKLEAPVTMQPVPEHQTPFGPTPESLASNTPQEDIGVKPTRRSRIVDAVLGR